MKKIFVILMAVTASFAFGIDKEAAKRELKKEQDFAARYQARLVANNDTIEKMINGAKRKDYQRRLTALRQKKYVLQYNLNRARKVSEKEKLISELDAVADEHAKLLQEYELFINGL
jgi:sensor histidine kinase regulating citrate/malate metabolism